MLVIPNQFAIGFQPRQVAGAGAGGQHDVLGGDFLGALVGLDADLAGRGQGGLAHDDGDLVFLEQVADAACQLLGHATRALDHGIEVIAGLFDRKPEFLGAVHEVEHLGRAQQRLGRDAAPVEADAAEILALDDRGFEAQLRRTDRRDITAGARADDDEIEFSSHDQINFSMSAFNASSPEAVLP